MATRGTEWIYDKNDISEKLKDSRGRITVACKKLGVHYETLKKVVDQEPELTLLLKNLREDFDNTILDMAENTIMRAMGKVDDDPNNGLKAAMYTLNSRGKSRGWNNTLNDTPQKVTFEVNYNNDADDTIKVSPETIPAQCTESSK